MKFYKILSLLLLATVSTLQATFPLSINQTFNGAGSEKTYLLDTYGTGVEVAYSLDAISSSFSNVAILRVRRGGDNVEQDFKWFEIRNGTLAAFTVAGSGDGEGYVVTWKDQSGNGEDVEQATAGDQPLIVTSGSVITENGNPAIQFVSANTPYLANTTISNTSNTSTAAAVFSVTTSTNAYIFDSVSGQRFGFRDSFSSFSLVDETPATVSTGLSISAGNQYLGTALYKNDAAEATLNGSTSSTLTPFTTSTSAKTGLSVGSFRNAGSWLNGTIQELVIWGSDQSSNGSAIRSDINSRYSIYSDYLLNNYTGSSGAYSLQEISEDFVGVDIIRVRRGGDNVEDDFTATESTDGTLETWTTAGSGDGEGYVTKWYDQSGNSRDMTRLTASAQPSIVSSGALLTSTDGNPAVVYSSADYLINATDPPINGKSSYLITAVCEATGDVFVSLSAGNDQARIGYPSSTSGWLYDGGPPAEGLIATGMSFLSDSIVTFEQLGADYEIFQNGLSKGSETKTNNTKSFDRIGQGTASGDLIISEIIFYDSASYSIY